MLFSKVFLWTGLSAIVVITIGLLARMYIVVLIVTEQKINEG